MARGIKRKLYLARKRVDASIVAQTDRENIFSRGLASEGYLGGYREALDDVLLALNGVKPNCRWDKDFWG